MIALASNRASRKSLINMALAIFMTQVSLPWIFVFSALCVCTRSSGPRRMKKHDPSIARTNPYLFASACTLLIVAPNAGILSITRSLVIFPFCQITASRNSRGACLSQIRHALSPTQFQPNPRISTSENGCGVQHIYPNFHLPAPKIQA